LVREKEKCFVFQLKLQKFKSNSLTLIILLNKTLKYCVVIEMKVKCPECGAEFDIPDDVVVGEIVSCPDCGLEFEITKVEKGNVELKPVQIAGEDWGE